MKPTSTFGQHVRTIADLEAEIARLQERVEEAERWVHDLQAGMYINCVYCGHRYGPDDEVPATMADALKEHIEQCPKHPMSALKALAERRKEALIKVLPYATAFDPYEYGRWGQPTQDDDIQEAEDAIKEKC